MIKETCSCRIMRPRQSWRSCVEAAAQVITGISPGNSHSPEYEGQDPHEKGGHRSLVCSKKAF